MNILSPKKFLSPTKFFSPTNSSTPSPTKSLTPANCSQEFNDFVKLKTHLEIEAYENNQTTYSPAFKANIKILQGIKNHYNESGCFDPFSIFSRSFFPSYKTALQELNNERPLEVKKFFDKAKLILFSHSDLNSIFTSIPKEVVIHILKIKRVEPFVFPSCEEFQGKIFSSLPNPLDDKSKKDIIESYIYPSCSEPH